MTHEEACSVAWHAFYAAYVEAITQPSRATPRDKNGNRIITNRLAREIRQAREQGLSYRLIAKAFDVTYSTACRYGSDRMMKTQQMAERRRHERMMTDPAYASVLEKKRQYSREYARKLREETNASRV